jgi:L-cysteine S-thiosulfotransferase
MPAARCFNAAKVSSTWHAPSVTMRTGARSSPANTIPQAHTAGYPLYRLEWHSVGSLQRGLRNCFAGVLAEAYAYGAPEFVDLELYLMWRARGMKVETPAVRP